MIFSIRTVLQTICVIYILFNVIGGTSAKKQIRRSRIAGGQQITIDKAPYIVQIRDKDGDTFCGGTLITFKCVITAAHCVDGVDSKTLTVVGGASTITEKGIQSKIIKSTMHPAYKSDQPHSDIAVVELASELRGKNIVTMPLCKQPLKKGDVIQVSGWGRLKDNVGGMSHNLNTVRLPVASQQQCEDEYGDEVHKNIFCASGEERKGICDGDSGGPAIFEGRLCGVNAFSSECGADLDPSGFIDINRVRDFIDEVMDKIALKK